MVQLQLIHSVIEWERRLEMDEERRKNHRFDPCISPLNPSLSLGGENHSIKSNPKPLGTWCYNLQLIIMSGGDGRIRWQLGHELIQKSRMGEVYGE